MARRHRPSTGPSAGSQSAGPSRGGAARTGRPRPHRPGQPSAQAAVRGHHERGVPDRRRGGDLDDRVVPGPGRPDRLEPARPCRRPAPHGRRPRPPRGRAAAARRDPPASTPPAARRRAGRRPAASARPAAAGWRRPGPATSRRRRRGHPPRSPRRPPAAARRGGPQPRPGRGEAGVQRQPLHGVGVHPADVLALAAGRPGIGRGDRVGRERCCTTSRRGRRRAARSGAPRPARCRPPRRSPAAPRRPPSPRCCGRRPAGPRCRPGGSTRPGAAGRPGPGRPAVGDPVAQQQAGRAVPAPVPVAGRAPDPAVAVAAHRPSLPADLLSAAGGPAGDRPTQQGHRGAGDQAADVRLPADVRDREGDDQVDPDQHADAAGVRADPLAQHDQRAEEPEDGAGRADAERRPAG